MWHEHESSSVKRIYTNAGQGISTKVTSLVDGKKYVISTAKDPRGQWQLAVFRIRWEIPRIFGSVDRFNPLRVSNSQTFEEAQKKHLEAEELVIKSQLEAWKNWP